MERSDLLTALASYEPADGREALMVQDTIRFIEKHENCFDRASLAGHVTASAWILNEGYSQALLIHHVKLDRWVQPGGHCDGDPDVMAVAIKEAFEETGLIVTPITSSIFDIDVHPIPAKDDVPSHLHYDISFAFTAEKGTERLNVNSEINGGRWTQFRDVQLMTNEESILRMVDKCTAVTVQNF